MTASIPAIVVLRNVLPADVPEATYINLRYRKIGAADWSLWPAVPMEAGGVVITGVAPLIPYEVEGGYTGVRGQPPSAWYPLGTITPGRLVANDSDAVGGRPGEELLDQVDVTLFGSRLNAESIIKRGLDQFAADKLTATLGYLTGKPVATAIVEETQNRIDGDTAIVETLSLLGAKSGDGLAWILDVAKVMVDPEESLGQRLTVLTAAQAENTASIAQLTEVFTDPDTASATWAVTLDVNGRVSGIKQQSISGEGVTLSTIDFLADRIRFYNGATDEPVFEVSGGNLYLSGDLVRSESLLVGSATRITSDQTIGSSTDIPSRGGSPGYILIKTMDFEVDRADSKFTVTVSFNYESSNSNVSYIWLKIGTVAPVWGGGGSAEMTNADATYLVAAYNGPATAIFTFEGLSVGTNTLELYAGSTGSGSHTNNANDCYFSVREDKKAA